MSVRHKMNPNKRKQCFELFGFDFLLDEDFRMWLIEINTNPALFTDTQVQKDMLPKLVDDQIKLALQLHANPSGEAKMDGAKEVRQFLDGDGLKALQLNYNIIYTDCE